MWSSRARPAPPVRADVRESLLDIGLESTMIEGGQERERGASGIVEPKRILKKRTMRKTRRGPTPVDKDAVLKITVIVGMPIKFNGLVLKRAVVELHEAPLVFEEHSNEEP